MSIPEVEASDVFSSRLPDGVRLRPFDLHADDRGWLAEIYRANWVDVPQVVQWNLVRSRPQTLRGVHVHGRHWDFLVVLQGRMQVGLRDLRRGRATHGRTAVVELTAEEPAALEIPPGVAHGFHSPVETLHAYGVSSYWSPDDELACRWNDPGLEIPWAPIATHLSPRDASAGSLSEMVERLERILPPRES